MQIFNYSDKKDRNELLKIITPKMTRDRKLESLVAKILTKVSDNGDSAVCQFTKAFDKAVIKPSQFKVTAKEIKSAYREIDTSFLKVAKIAIKNITEYHQFQKRETRSYQRKDGTVLTQRVSPLTRVGIYVPGGAAPLASSLLMCTIPAKVAGVPEIVVATPPNKEGKINPYILVCADLVGVTEIYKIGGVQAIGALAYGTDTIPKVDKIVGAGNKYVVEAKRQVYGTVDVDLIPGPSEILVIADDTAKPSWVAADLLSQAEHTGNERVFLVTPSIKLSAQVVTELQIQLDQLSRKDAAGKSLINGGAIILTNDLEQAAEVANAIAPEHLELMVKNPRKWVDKIKYAGAIFVGPWTPEPMGDYIAGTNHILPTSGTARMFSGLNLDEFIKKTNIVELTEKAFHQLAKATVQFAEVEQLTAHAQSVRVRMKGKK